MSCSYQSRSARYILLTGPPGIGKTTLVKKICEKLNENNVTTKGFYTEEIRQSGRRIGFDVVSLDGQRSPLARLAVDCAQEVRSTPRVGQYAVQLKSFENVALPLLKLSDPSSVIVIDEIGKMELFSKEFEKLISNIFKSNQNIVLATIPVPKGKPIGLVEMIRKHPEAKVVMVDSNNRNNLDSDILKHLLTTLQVPH